MWQDLTEEDFQYVHSSIKKSNLLKIYNLIRNFIDTDEEGLSILNNYYFDDKFYWKFPYEFQRKKDFVLENMISGLECYNYQMDITSIADEINRMIIRKRKKENKTALFEKHQQKRYIEIIFNKIRPTQEYYDTVLKQRIEQKNQEKQEEIKRKEEERQQAKTNEEKELEEYTKWSDEKKVNESIKKDNKVCNNSFIYGIYIDGELAYIGKTIRELKSRLGEHIEWSLLQNGGGSQQNYLYKAMRECQIGYKFVILYESHNVLNNHDLEQIEKTLIENLKPKFNYEGVKVPYKFSDEK